MNGIKTIKDVNHSNKAYTITPTVKIYFDLKIDGDLSQFFIDETSLVSDDKYNNYSLELIKYGNGVFISITDNINLIELEERTWSWDLNPITVYFVSELPEFHNVNVKIKSLLAFNQLKEFKS